MRIFEAFAGIGAQIEALKNISRKFNFSVEHVGAIEWYIDAIVVYQAFHEGIKSTSKLRKQTMINNLSEFVFSNDSKNAIKDNFFCNLHEKKLRKIYPYLINFVRKQYNYTDIQECKNIPENIDIFTYSFPCQDLSNQGKQQGLKKGTKSSLLYEVHRILSVNADKLPKILVMENVSALANKKFKKKLQDWINKLEKIGYKSDYKILRSSDYGSPQNRNRIFVVSWLDKTKKFVWPEPIIHNKTIKSIIDFKYDGFDDCENLNQYKYTKFIKNKNNVYKAKLLNYTNFSSENQVFLYDGFGPTLTASGANSRIKIFFPDNKKIRMLSDVECGKYMGFNEKKILSLKSKELISKTNLIFLFGNSISVEMLQSVFSSIISNLLS